MDLENAFAEKGNWKSDSRCDSLQQNEAVFIMPTLTFATERACFSESFHKTKIQRVV